MDAYVGLPVSESHDLIKSVFNSIVVRRERRIKSVVSESTREYLVLCFDCQKVLSI